MKTHEKWIRIFTGNECGTALVTALLMTVLLGTACIAMLSAAGASARNSTDVLSETKAYYAAESGIQAAVNVLRYSGAGGGPVNYKTAINNFSNSGDLTLGGTGLTYTNCGADSRVVISGDCNNGYAVTVTDPDNSQSALSFRTSGVLFRAAGGSTWGASRQFGTDPNTATTITWVPNAQNPTALTFDAAHPNQTTPIGGFNITNGPTGGTTMDTATDFKVFYSLELPGNPGWLITGQIATNGAVTILSAKYTVTGSDIVLCGNSNSCGTISVPSTSVGAATSPPFPISAVVEPKEPTRLLVTSSGFGPNKANKVLVAVLQKSPLDGANSSSPFTMNGPCAEPGNPSNVAVFDAGKSAVTTYSGVSTGGVVAPAFAFNTQCNLDAANAYITQNLTKKLNQVSPPPQNFDTSQLPDWQRTPLALDNKVQQYRDTAQYAGTWYNPATHKITDPGYVAGQTGPITTVTFCEGDCTVDGSNGGGILVVTGTLSSLGGFSFKGLILVTGPGGWSRAGGGCGTITGNVVISPYTSANLVTNVFTLPPKYQITGAGCSGDVYASLDDLFLGENKTVTNYIRGVAEK